MVHFQVSSLPGHSENEAGSTCAWNLVRRWPWLRFASFTGIEWFTKDSLKSALKSLKCQLLGVLSFDGCYVILSLKSSNIEHFWRWLFFSHDHLRWPLFPLIGGRYEHLKNHDFAYILWTHSFRQWNLAVYPEFGKGWPLESNIFEFSVLRLKRFRNMFVVRQSSSPI